MVDFALNDEGTGVALTTGKTPDIEDLYLHGTDTTKVGITAAGL